MKTSKFQIITLAIFVVAIIAGAASFALYKGSSGSATLPDVSIWGTFPADIFNKYVSNINNTLASPLKVNYIQYKLEDFSKNFVNALALGQGPDAVLIPSEMLLSEFNKLIHVPYTVLPKDTFFNSYIDEARIYLSDNGVQAIPFSVDPIVMYWNRDNFNSAGIATYPKYWDEFTGSSLKPGLAQKLTSKDQNGNIRKSAIAMGDFSNITNAREVMGSLLLQSGNPVTMIGNGGVVSTISTSYSASPIPAFRFFSQFADPSNANYSWNKGMVNDKSAFLSGVLSTYFSFASELSSIKAKNPNLNFDVAPIPQLRTGGQKSGYAKMYGFSLVRASTKLDAVFQVISTLTTANNLKDLSQTMYLPSVRRDVIAIGSTDPYITIFNQAVLVSKTWIDVDASKSGQIFSNLVQAVTSGQKNIDQAVRDAGDQYNVVLKQAGQ
ncbi:MAG: ABC transporter substrate-binding protein [Candidatus Paceibacterota bacterium]